MDACKNAKDMWEQIKRLMFGSDVTSHVRPSRLMDEFDKFAAKEGESVESVYERLTMLVNIMDRNNVRPIPVSINSKFLNCLQPEWRKYVTGNGYSRKGQEERQKQTKPSTEWKRQSQIKAKVKSKPKSKSQQESQPRKSLKSNEENTT
ncbi:hypothetical protein Tco_1087423 [Tanacetum coccineum]